MRRGLPDQCEDRQISQALAILGDFVAARLPAARCGNAPREPRQSRPADLYPTAAAGGGLEPPAAVNPAGADADQNTAFYIYDWLIGLQTLLAENAATESALGAARGVGRDRGNPALSGGSGSKAVGEKTG